MQAWRKPKGEISPAELREEGVIEVGRARGTAALFVLTEEKLHIIHARNVPDRALDDYAISIAVAWLEFGHTNYEVASNLGIDPNHLSRELVKAGYARISMQDGKPRDGTTDKRIREAKSARAKKRGNRRGRLVQVSQNEQKFAFERTISP